MDLSDINSYKSMHQVPGGGQVPRVSTKISLSDFMGAVMVRCGIRRDNFRVNPGLYAVGTPGPDDDVFVTANYKLSFDALRRSLSGINGWILVLDTKGINVWCAAGKGTFGTRELVSRIGMVSLEKVVDHRRLILPQLGAVGVAAHKVRAESGFNVHYGPVRAADIKKFIKEGYRADSEMRSVTFGLADRAKLIPNDLLYGKYYLLGAIALLCIISGLSGGSFSFRTMTDTSGPSVLIVILAYLSGIVVTPLLLPWLPGRSFSFKGFTAGTFLFIFLLVFNYAGAGLIEMISWYLLITAISSFLAMNFTGSSTYTSLSGVKKEMKVAVPLQIGFAVTGLVIQVIDKFI